MTTARIILAVLALASLLPAAEPPAGPATLTGTLQGGIVAIGGETTGWQLRYAKDGKKQTIDVEMGAIKEPGQYDGKQVTIDGRIINKDYVERGPTPILVAAKVELQERHRGSSRNHE